MEVRPVSIVTYNVNGIRAAIKKGFLEWVGQNDIDIICLQEVKAMESDVDLSRLQDLGYHCHWHCAEKKGYSGVAIFSKIAPDRVICGCGIDEYDAEGRVIRADFGNTTLINTYFPSGTSGDHRQQFKYRFLKDYSNFIKALREERKDLIICGDYNIAHTPLDIHNPVSNKNSSGFLPEEREWLSSFYDDGFIDAFRHFNKDPHNYTWWSYRFNSRKNNKGWRIDYIAISEKLLFQVSSCQILSNAFHSDHCPVMINITL